MGAPQYEQAGADVAGSGTPGTIPVWSSGTTLGDSQLVQSATAIYTTTRSLVVGGSTPLVTAAGRGNITVNGTAGGILSFGLNGAEAGYLWHGGTDLYLWNTANGLIGFGSNNTQRMVLTSTGNVGIGTASPTQKLDVRGRIYTDNSFFAAVGAPLFLADAGGASNVSIDSNSAGQMRFRVANSSVTAATIDSSGNVGIGTASPVASAKLTLGGAANSSIRLSYQTGGTTEVAFDQMNSATGEFRHSSGVSVGWGGFHTFYTDTTEKVRISNTSMDASLVSGYGLKLPATPGNADTQTLDCYQEGTWAPTLAGFGGTNPTVTASYTRVGRLVTIAVQIDATGGNQYSMALGTTTITTPATMTASSICAVPVVDGGVANRGIASVWTTGIIYLPTVALTTSSIFFVATYRV